MSAPMTVNDFVKAFDTVQACTSLLTPDSQGVIHKASLRAVANFAFTSVSSTEDLDNPTTKGIFSVNADTVITRPTKGTGWTYGFVLNFAITAGIQLWLNHSGYIAIRGKGSSSTPWTEWFVMQRMS